MKLDGSRVNSLLSLSPRLDQVLGGSKYLYLPEYKRDDSILQYAITVRNLIKNRIAFIAEQHSIKKLFITTLVAICSGSMVEYDSETFNKVVFLSFIEDYTCLVSLIIGEPL